MLHFNLTAETVKAVPSNPGKLNIRMQPYFDPTRRNFVKAVTSNLILTQQQAGLDRGGGALDQGQEVI